jgi:DNA-binding transcriptional LysR family regulator
MEIRPLRYFVEVVRLRSFTRAAESLHISQPSISKMIKNLEDELGVVLLDRSARGVQLTDAGEVVYARATQVVGSLDDLSTELDDLLGLHRGAVRVGIPPMVGVSFFPGVLAEFHALYPHVALRLYEQGARRVEQAVAEGDLDLGIVLLPVDDEQFETFPFVQEHLQLVVHPGHPLAGRTEVSLRDLDRLPFVLFREDFALHGRIRRLCDRLGVELNIVCESSQWDFIGEMAAAGLGVALLPETICRRLDPDRVRTVPLTDPPIPWHLAVIWRRDRYLSFAARGWLDFVRSRLAPGGPVGYTGTEVKPR